MKQASDSVKKVSLELGGNAPLIIFDDVDLDEIIEQVFLAKVRNGGQTCICPNRFFVHEKLLKNFINLITKRLENLKIGSGLDPEVGIGPLINVDACLKIERLLAEAISNGAKILMGGKRENQETSIFPPTIITGVKQHMEIAKQEIFGPVIAIQSFCDDEEVLAYANDTSYGLASYFFTNNMKRAFYFSNELKYGLVGVNQGMISKAEAPFGGVKESGIGREGSKYGIDEYLEIKYVCLKP